MGFTVPRTVAGRAVRSYRTLSILPGRSLWQPAFCCTVPGVAPAGRYPASLFRGARTFLAPFAWPAAARPSGCARP